MRKTLSTMAAATVVLSTLVPTAGAFAKTVKHASPAYVTQQQAITDLIAAFNKVPSWPGKIILKKYNTSVPAYANPYFRPDRYPFHEPITLTAWVGLKCVFPNVPPSQWAQKLNMTASRNPNIVTYATAGQVAQWVQYWAKKARNTFPGYEGMPTNAYQLMTDFTLWHGTHVTSPSSKLTPADMTAIGQNLFAAAVGYRMLNHSTMEFVPVLGEADFNSTNKAYEQSFFKLFKEGITLIFKPNGTAIYHRATTSGFDLEIGKGAPLSTGISSFENGFDDINVVDGTQQGKPNPIFYGAVNAMVKTGQTGELPFEGASIVTPTSWKNPISPSIGGTGFFGVIHYSKGQITWIDSLGYQYSPYGYPGK